MNHEESFIESCRRRVEEQYANVRLGSGAVGGCFGSILCHELHHGGPDGGMHFTALARKWGIPVTVLGELIWDHCKRLEPLLQVDHSYLTPRNPNMKTVPLLEAIQAMEAGKVAANVCGVRHRKIDNRFEWFSNSKRAWVEADVLSTLPWTIEEPPPPLPRVFTAKLKATGEIVAGAKFANGFHCWCMYGTEWGGSAVESLTDIRFDDEQEHAHD